MCDKHIIYIEKTFMEKKMINIRRFQPATDNLLNFSFIFQHGDVGNGNIFVCVQRKIGRMMASRVSITVI